MRNDLVGKRFGKLVAKELLGSDQGRALWLCQCDCGSLVKTRRHTLTSYGKESCGCDAKIEHLINNVLRRYKRQAKSRGLSFNLTTEQMSRFMFSKCSYCGRPPSNKETKIDINYSGIDRMDNKKGYEVGNCVAACVRCNRAKSDMSVSEFHHWIVAVYEESICDKD